MMSSGRNGGSAIAKAGFAVVVLFSVYWMKEMTALELADVIGPIGFCYWLPVIEERFLCYNAAP